MTDARRANYALLEVLEHLGPSKESLKVEWAEFSGDHSTPHEFTVPTGEATDTYLEVQVYDVGTFGHDIRLNGESLSGFDIPPGDGWQYWMDAVPGQHLRAEENTLQIRRETASEDAFAVGNVVVNWREPVEPEP